jgi:hypothetical protein
MPSDQSSRCFLPAGLLDSSHNSSAALRLSKPLSKELSGRGRHRWRVHVPDPLLHPQLQRPRLRPRGAVRAVRRGERLTQARERAAGVEGPVDGGEGARRDAGQAQRRVVGVQQAWRGSMWCWWRLGRFCWLCQLCRLCRLGLKWPVDVVEADGSGVKA